MKNKNVEQENIDYVNRIVRPIFSKVAKETQLNHRMGGSTSKLHKGFVLYQPHNYRLYFDFSKENFTAEIPTKPHPTPMVIGSYQYKPLNHSKEHGYYGFMGCNLRVKKKQIEIVNQIDSKKWYRIELGNTKEVQKQIERIVKTKNKQCVEALENFILLHGGNSNLKILKHKASENKLKSEASIELIPSRMKFYTPIVKKVYNENNVEFSDPTFVAKFLENRAIEDISPDIAQAIKGLATTISESKYIKRPLERLKENIISIADIFKDTNKKLIQTLNPEEKIDFELWLFNNLSI